jgi:hypothetical protein
LQTRNYTVTKQLTIAAVMDLMALYPGSGGPICLRKVTISPVNRTTLEMLLVSIKRLRTTVTTGSGGTSITPRKVLGGDAAATTTARSGDTTQATTSGTSELLHGTGWNEVNGAMEWFGNGSEFTCNVNEALIVSLDSAPAVSVIANVTAEFGEAY